MSKKELKSDKRETGKEPVWHCGWKKLPYVNLTSYKIFAIV